jgi:hypothetical protein
MSLRFF